MLVLSPLLETCVTPVVFTFPTVITEGKYGNQLKKIRKFRVVLSSGSHETGSRAKKVTASDSAKPGPHMHIFWYGAFYIWALMPLNFYGDRERGLEARTKLLGV